MERLEFFCLSRSFLRFPRRYEFGPPWVDAAFIATLLAIFLASVATNLVHTPGRVRNASILAVVGLMSVYNALALWDLIVFLLFPDANRPEIEAPRLLASAVSIWLTNVLAFALLYWAIDGGGPERRLRDPEGVRDFVFPADPATAELRGVSFSGVQHGHGLQPDRHAAADHARPRHDDARIDGFVDGARDHRGTSNQYFALAYCRAMAMR